MTESLPEVEQRLLWLELESSKETFSSSVFNPALLEKQGWLPMRVVISVIAIALVLSGLGLWLGVHGIALQGREIRTTVYL